MDTQVAHSLDGTFLSAAQVAAAGGAQKNVQGGGQVINGGVALKTPPQKYKTLRQIAAERKTGPETPNRKPRAGLYAGLNPNNRINTQMRQSLNPALNFYRRRDTALKNFAPQQPQQGIKVVSVLDLEGLDHRAMKPPMRPRPSFPTPMPG